MGVKDCGNKFLFNKQEENIERTPKCPFDCPYREKIEELLNFMKEQKQIISSNEEARVLHTKLA